MSLYQILSALRSYAALADPDFERVHLRDERGRFSRGRRWGAAKPAEGKRVRKRDRLIARDVTSAEDGRHSAHPDLRGAGGQNVERALHHLLAAGDASGFTMTRTAGNEKLHRALARAGQGEAYTYAYYLGGKREQNGRPNGEHLTDLRAHLREKLRGRAEVHLLRQTGHVKNGGWNSEDHMETVHNGEGGAEIERSAQGVLVVQPHPSVTDRAERAAVLREAARLTDERAKATGFRWDVPDARLLGVAPHPEDDTWVRLPQVTVEVPGGVYTLLHSPVPPPVNPKAKVKPPKPDPQAPKPTEAHAQAELMRHLGASARDVWLPREWGEFIGPVTAHAVGGVREALYSKED